MTLNLNQRATRPESGCENFIADFTLNAFNPPPKLKCSEPKFMEDTEKRQFHLFSRLDPILRLKIWRLAHDSSSRTVQVRLRGFPNQVIYRFDDDFDNDTWEIYSCQTPTLLAVCHESRNVLLPKYSTPFDDSVEVFCKADSIPGGRFLFCWDTDLLLIDIEEYWAEEDYLPRVFTEIFGHYYTGNGNSPNSSPSISLVKQNLRRLGGNFEFWYRALGTGNLGTANAAFFDRFSNLEEVVFVPFFQRRRKNQEFRSILARCDEFEGEILRGPWGRSFQREFRRGLQKWLPDEQNVLKKLRRDNLGLYDSKEYRHQAIPLYSSPTRAKVAASRLFTLFPRLPPELRAEIWKLSFPPQRYIDFVSTSTFDDYGYATSLKGCWHAVAGECAPVHFFVSQEARAELLRYYQPLKANDNHPTIYSNLKMDVLCFYSPCPYTVSSFVNTISDRARNDITRIQGLRLSRPVGSIPCDLRRLPNLREVRIEHHRLLHHTRDRNQPSTTGWEEHATRELTDDEGLQVERWNLDAHPAHPSIRFGRRLVDDRAFIN